MQRTKAGVIWNAYSTILLQVHVCACCMLKSVLGAMGISGKVMKVPTMRELIV